MGETQTRASNVRILAATNRDLEAEIAAGRFREDLFYRLNVIEVTVPPLRQRPADILPLAEHLLRFFARQNGKHVAGFGEPVREAIRSYSWPGNVRELRNAVERAVILATEAGSRRATCPAQIIRGQRPPAIAAESMTLEQLEAEHIRRILAASADHGRSRREARHRSQHLYRKRKKYGI